jgi:transcriptional regulator with XRE-family HTH domain
MSETISREVAPPPSIREDSPLMTERVPAIMRRVRKERCLTLYEIAARMGTTPQTLQRLETGNMTLSLDWVDRWLAALRLPIDALIEPRSRKEIFVDAKLQAAAQVALQLRQMAENLEKGNL